MDMIAHFKALRDEAGRENNMDDYYKFDKAMEDAKDILLRAQAIEKFAAYYAQGEERMGTPEQFACWLMGRANGIRQAMGEF